MRLHIIYYQIAVNIEYISFIEYKNCILRRLLLKMIKYIIYKSQIHIVYIISTII